MSGIQHFVFCPRQWALIHLEQQWEDNALTIEGHLLHENVDNPNIRERNGSAVITLRGVRLASKKIGLSGVADAVELHPYPDAPSSKQSLLDSRQFDIFPVEYKRGKIKVEDCDRIQLAAQAMILEEIFDKKIDCGAIFYWEMRHREYVNISMELRETVIAMSQLMHKCFEQSVTPKAIRQSRCRSCSLLDICAPSLLNKNVTKYLDSNFDEEVT